jgi:hypothetical protein
MQDSRSAPFVSICYERGPLHLTKEGGEDACDKGTTYITKFPRLHLWPCCVGDEFIASAALLMFHSALF